MMKAEVIKDAKGSGWRFSEGQNVGAVLQFFLTTVIKFKANHSKCVMGKPGRHRLDPLTGCSHCWESSVTPVRSLVLHSFLAKSERPESRPENTGWGNIQQNDALLKGRGRRITEKKNEVNLGQRDKF